MDKLIEESDFLSLHCPLNTETYHLINESKLRRMKKNSYIINTARGEIINETHLIKALKKKWIAGAGLDVFEKEPSSPNNPSIENEECCVIAPYRQCYIFN